MKLLNAGLIHLSTLGLDAQNLTLGPAETRGGIQHMKIFHLENSLMGNRWTRWSNEVLHIFNFHDSAEEVFWNFPNPRQIPLISKVGREGGGDWYLLQERSCPWLLERWKAQAGGSGGNWSHTTLSCLITGRGREEWTDQAAGLLTLLAMERPLKLSSQ